MFAYTNRYIPPASGDEANGCGGRTYGTEHVQRRREYLRKLHDRLQESILCALKTYRDWGRETKGIRKPNIVACVTAHAAFDKGCQYWHPIETQRRTPRQACRRYPESHGRQYSRHRRKRLRFKQEISTVSMNCHESRCDAGSVSTWTAVWEDSSFPSWRRPDFPCLTSSTFDSRA